MMKPIISNDELGMLAARAFKVIDRSKALPNNVFTSDFEFFQFITFDEIFMGIFFNHIRQYLIASRESCFSLVALDDSDSSEIDSILSAVQFDQDDTESFYLETINGLEDDLSIQMHASDVIIALSDNDKWCIFGDREAEIAICAFSSDVDMKKFISTYESGLLGNVQMAAEYAYGESEDTSYATNFSNHYLR